MRPQYIEAMLFRDVATVRPYRNSRGLTTNSLRQTRLWKIGQLIILTPRVLSDIFGSVPYAAMNYCNACGPKLAAKGYAFVDKGKGRRIVEISVKIWWWMIEQPERCINFHTQSALRKRKRELDDVNLHKL